MVYFVQYILLELLLNTGGKIELMFFDVICDLAGHSMAIREGHYRKERC